MDTLLEELRVQSQYRLLEKLRESETRYRSLYKYAPIGLWEQDWSETKIILNQLKKENTDLLSYLLATEHAVWRIAASIKVIDANDMALHQVSASSKADIKTWLNTYINTHSLEGFCHVFATFFYHLDHFQFECPIIRLDGQQCYHWVSLIIPPGHEQTLDSIIVTTSDITEYKRIQMLLKKNQEFLRMSQLAGGIGSWEADLITNQQIWSDAVKSVLGFPELEHPTWNDFLKVVYSEDRQKLIDATQAHLKQSKPYQVEYRIIDKEQKIRWMCSIGCVERDEKNIPRIIRGIVQDITQRKRAEEKLRLGNQIFVTTQEAIMITDTDCNLIDVNAAFTQITGYTKADVLGKNPRILKSGHHDTQFYADMWATINSTDHWTGEIWNRRKNGDVYAELITISAIRDDRGILTHYVGISSDITVLKQHEKQLEHIAHYDALTGIPNRILLVDRMQQALAQTKRKKNLLAVCYLDLDGFKPINDTLGHEAGDKVLVEIAKRISHTIRGGDTVARLGGDEFVILLLGIENQNECHISIERLLNVIAEPITVVGHNEKVTASIGVTLYPNDNEDVDILLRHADQAMYLAKQAGKNRYHIFDSIKETKKTYHNQIADIEQRFFKHEFELFYQPKVLLCQNKIIGVEALIRWRHPQLGLLLPNQFLPLIENSAFELTLSNWIIDSALQQMSKWYANNLKLEVSVNVSINQLHATQFAETLHQKLLRYPSEFANYFQLEILETAALLDIQKTSEIINQCKTFGVSCALDDFGTGYSSLSYLRKLSASTLKIDLSFIGNMLINHEDYAIVKGIIALAQAFNLTTVAEGIESINHFQALRDMGCDIGQGYGIARPMPACELFDWYQNTLIPNPML